MCKFHDQPGWMGDVFGRSHNSGGVGLQPEYSYTPSTYITHAYAFGKAFNFCNIIDKILCTYMKHTCFRLHKS